MHQPNSQLSPTYLIQKKKNPQDKKQNSNNKNQFCTVPDRDEVKPENSSLFSIRVLLSLLKFPAL